MPYLIDGHNLIGKLPDIDLLDPNDEAKLVQKLISFHARTQKQCVVVFDAGLPGGTSRMSRKGVKVLFASHASNADEVMMARIRKEPNPKKWTIVSSDNRVLELALSRKMSVLKSSEFAEMMVVKPTPKPDISEATDVHLSPQEVDEWMRLFGDGSDSPARKSKLSPPHKQARRPSNNGNGATPKSEPTPKPANGNATGKKHQPSKPTVEPGVVRASDVPNAAAVFNGTRVPVQHLIDYLLMGETINSFLRDFPTVDREQVINFLQNAVDQAPYKNKRRRK